jgi:hypothetical protein
MSSDYLTRYAASRSGGPGFLPEGLLTDSLPTGSPPFQSREDGTFGAMLDRYLSDRQFNFDGDLLLLTALARGGHHGTVGGSCKAVVLDAARIAYEHANMLGLGPRGKTGSLLALELKRRTNGREES